MGEELFRLTILGARGSIPVSGKEFNIYGGESSSYMVEIGNQVIFLDAGTGIINAPDLRDRDNVCILLSHTHHDHILGLTFFPELSNKNEKIYLYGRRFNGESIAEQIEKVFSEPYWPLTISHYLASVEYKDFELPLELSEGDEKIVIKGIEVPHPGGCLAFSILYKGKKLVYMSDCELPDEEKKELTDFSLNADLLLIDAQYTDEEYKDKKGFGHSTFNRAVLFAQNVASKKTIIIHHDPRHDDKMLGDIEKSIGNSNICLARNGMTIDLLG